MRRVLAVLFVLVAAAVLVSGPRVPGAAAAVPVVAEVTGPTALAPSETAQYNISISGGPGGEVNYSVVYYITGSNTTGGTPSDTAPGRLSGNVTSYQFNITAPLREQRITLTVTLSAKPLTGGTAENTTVQYAITVIKPIVLTATFHNGAATAALNVTVRYYVDGVFVGTNVLARIAPNGDATATFDYLPVGLTSGQHTVRVVADFGGGQTATSTIFYNQVSSLAPGWYFLMGLGAFVLVFFVVVALRRRGQT